MLPLPFGLSIRRRILIYFVSVTLCQVFLAPCSATASGTNTELCIMATFLRGVWARIKDMFMHRAEEMPRYTFPDTLEGFGYQFNEKGELVNKDGGRFQFVVREGDRNYNQQHYDALGEVVTEYLYSLMEKDIGLQKVFIPDDAEKEEAQSFIFKSKDALINEKLMVLIHGSGAVRAGQWSRKLIINENIATGAQLPYIRRAIADGYGVIVMNPNLNSVIVNGKPVKIRGSESPEDHGVYVWQKFVMEAKAQNIVIVAHSYGGIVTCTIAEDFLEDFKQRVFCVVYTDSVHTANRAKWSEPVKQFMKERAVNFASAYVPLDTQLDASKEDDCLSVSAGTKEHERTSHSCIDSAFKFIRDNFNTWSRDRTMAPRNFLPLPEDLEKYSPAKRWEEEVKKREEEQKSKRESEAGGEESLSKNDGAKGAEKDGPETKADTQDGEKGAPETKAHTQDGEKDAPETKADTQDGEKDKDTKAEVEAVSSSGETEKDSAVGGKNEEGTEDDKSTDKKDDDDDDDDDEDKKKKKVEVKSEL